MKLYIKNMISLSCRMVVKSEVEKIGLHCTSIETGELEIQEDISFSQFTQLKASLQKFGLELTMDKKNVIVEKIKNAIADAIQNPNEQIKIKFSEYLSEKLNCSYRYLAKKFLETHGTTIEKHVISCRIERVNELLLNDELSLTEIAYKLNYSSVAHLSNQFKKVTGITPSGFKGSAPAKRFYPDTAGALQEETAYQTAEIV